MRILLTENEAKRLKRIARKTVTPVMERDDGEVGIPDHVFAQGAWELLMALGGAAHVEIEQKAGNRD